MGGAEKILKAGHRNRKWGKKGEGGPQNEHGGRKESRRSNQGGRKGPSSTDPYAEKETNRGRSGDAPPTRHFDSSPETDSRKTKTTAEEGTL